MYMSYTFERDALACQHGVLMIYQFANYVYSEEKTVSQQILANWNTNHQVKYFGQNKDMLRKF